LKSMENDLRIVGHTDTTPSTDPRYVNHFELSVGRAMVVSEYLINGGIDPSRITVSGKGEYDPIFANDTEEHKAMNSRAEIVIIYPDNSSSFTNIQ